MLINQLSTNSADAAEADEQGCLCVLMVQLHVLVMHQNTKKQDMVADVCASLMLMLLGLGHSSLCHPVATDVTDVAVCCYCPSNPT